MTETIKLPSSKTKAESINPKRLVIYGKPKVGKTTALAGLENNLILDLEEGSNYVDAIKIKIKDLAGIKEVGKQIKEAGYPYKYVTLDTVTVLEDMVGPLAVQLYKQTSMGKNFDGDNVLKLANGAGQHVASTHLIAGTS